MCLNKRIESCRTCVDIQDITFEMELIENLMEDNAISEGKYLEKMNQIKKKYNFVNKAHKIHGCSDCIIDDEPEDDSHSDDVVVVEVIRVNRDNVTELEDIPGNWISKHINNDVYVSEIIYNSNMRMVYNPDNDRLYRDIYYDNNDNNFKQLDHWIDHINT